MSNRKFKLCRLVRENDGRYRVYWNTVNPDGTTKNNKRRVRDRKEGLERCRMLEEELSRKGLNEEMPVSPEDRIMMEKFYKTNPSISLAEFIRRYMGCVSHPRQGRTVKGLHAEWKKHRLLTSPNRENLRMTLARVRLFKEAFGNRIVSTVRKEEAEQWLFGLDVAEKTRQHYRSAVISFFKWCDIDMSGIKCPRAVRPEPGTYTVDEAVQILHYTKTHRKNMLAPLAIAMFCGVRLSEFAYITWEELDLSHPAEDGDFYLAGGKTGRRIVHLPSVAKKWLLACERRNGLVFDFSRCKIHADRIYDAFRRTIPGHVEAKQNGFRHSYCTYKVTCFGNMSDVADEMGNSFQMIRKHYYRPTRKKDAGLYWKLTPEYVDSIFA